MERRSYFNQKKNRRLAAKGVTIARPTLFNYIATREEFEFYVNELFELLGSGKLKVRIHKIYPLEDVQQAHKVRANFFAYLTKA